MGDEIKITVIATGFRDQMPERRARMLNVEEAPVVSVPVVAPGNWMREKTPEPEPAAKPARFMSEDEEAEESADDAFFFAAAAPGVTTTLSVAVPPKAAEDHALDFGRGMREQSMRRRSSSAGWSAKHNMRPNPGTTLRISMKLYTAGRSRLESCAQSEPSLFSETGGENERDLDVPTFLRRLQF